MSINNFFHRLWQITCFLFLALVCVGQVYQSTHIHHFHTDDSVTLSVSAHPLAPEPVQAQNHHHHDDSSHEDENEHNYKKKTDWNVARSKSTSHLTYDLLGESVPTYTLGPVVFDQAYPTSQVQPCRKERYAAFLIIRGPPQFA